MVKRTGQARRLEAFYQQSVDPWGFEIEEYEQERYAATLAVLDRGRYEDVLEIGCGEGAFTFRLAERAGRVLGVDISETAIGRARSRSVEYPNTSFIAMDIGAALPQGKFDLIVCSEVFYYVRPFSRLNIARRLLERLAPDGELLLVHSHRSETTTWPDVYGEGGAEGLHRLFTHYLTMITVTSRAMDGYQIDLLRPNPEFNGIIRPIEMARLAVANTRAVVTHDVSEAARAILARTQSLGRRTTFQ